MAPRIILIRSLGSAMFVTVFDFDFMAGQATRRLAHGKGFEGGCGPDPSEIVSSQMRNDFAIVSDSCFRVFSAHAFTHVWNKCPNLETYFTLDSIVLNPCWRREGDSNPRDHEHWEICVFTKEFTILTDSFR